MENSEPTQLSIPLTPSYTPHSPLMYSAISRDGGLRIILSVSLPTSHPQEKSTAINVRVDGAVRARLNSQTRCSVVNACHLRRVRTGRKLAEEIVHRRAAVVSAPWTAARSPHCTFRQKVPTLTLFDFTQMYCTYCVYFKVTRICQKCVLLKAFLHESSTMQIRIFSLS